MDRRVYVGVELVTDAAGTMTPTAIIWGDGRRWPVRVVGRRPPRTDTANRWQGVRYTVEVGRSRRRRTLWYEPPSSWYVVTAKERERRVGRG